MTLRGSSLSLQAADRTSVRIVPFCGAVGSGKVDDLQVHFIPERFGDEPFEVFFSLCDIFPRA